MRRRLISLYVLVVLCVTSLCRTAYALDAPFRLELRAQGGTALERPLETWFFLEDGRAYATSGELCAWSKAAGEAGTEVITLAGGPFTGGAITVDEAGSTATADRSGTACAFGVVAMPGPFRASVSASGAAGQATLLASRTGGAEGPVTYRFHVFDGKGGLVAADARADGALPLDPDALGACEAFVTAVDAEGAVSDCASAAVADAPGGGGPGVATLRRTSAGATAEATATPDEEASLGSAPYATDSIVPRLPQEGLGREAAGRERPEKPEIPGDPEGPAKPDDPVKPEDPEATTLPINRKARSDVEGYALYANPSGAGPQPVANASLSGNFHADVYQDILRDPRRGDGRAELTMMIYLCGTDLEGKQGAASKDLVNVLRANYDLSQVNVLVLAGGTMSWKSEVMQENNSDVRLCLYYLDPDGVIRDTGADVKDLSSQPGGIDDILTGDTAGRRGSMRLLGTYDQACMGDSELLRGFLDAAYDLFPADHYWLSIWDHGAGSEKGICFGDRVSKDENASAYRGVDVSGDPLTLARIEEALGGSKIVRDHGDLDILSLDACLMAGIEEAHNFSPYVRFMIASEETTTGNIPYDDYLGVFRTAGGGTDMSAGEIAVNAARSFISKGTSEGLEPATMSVYDLKEVDECAAAMNAFGYAMAALLKNEATSKQAAACLEKSVSRTFNFEHDDDEGSDYIDLYDFLTRLEAYLSYEQRQGVEQDAEASGLYQAATKAISELLQVPFVAYRGGLFAGSYIQEDDATQREDLLPLDASNSELTGLWGALGYDYLSGVTVYFPRLVTTLSLRNYGEESVLPGYVEMLDQYLKVTRTPEHVKKYERVIKEFSDDYGALFDDMRIERCAWVDRDGVERQGLALYLSFDQDAEPTRAVGLDPVAAFTQVVHKYSVLVLKDQPEAGVGDSEGYDVVVGRSLDFHPGEGVTGRVTLDELTGELDDTSGVAFNLTMANVYGYLVKATEDGAEDAGVSDWGLAHAKEKDLKEALKDKKPEFAESWRGAFSGLDGIVYKADDGGESVAYDAVLIFGKEPEGDAYAYKGAILAPADAKDLSVGEDAWMPANDDNSLGISLYHYRLNDDRNGLVRMEGKGDLADPTFSFERVSNPTMERVQLADPDGFGVGSQERDISYALEITDVQENVSVIGIDNVDVASSGGAGGLFGAGSAVAEGLGRSAAKDAPKAEGDARGDDASRDEGGAGQGGGAEGHVAASESGTDGKTGHEPKEAGTAEEASPHEEAGPSEEPAAPDGQGC